jgi:hypothetical protein
MLAPPTKSCVRKPNRISVCSLMRAGGWPDDKSRKQDFSRGVRRPGNDAALGVRCRFGGAWRLVGGCCPSARWLGRCGRQQGKGRRSRLLRLLSSQDCGAQSPGPNGVRRCRGRHTGGRASSRGVGSLCLSPRGAALAALCVETIATFQKAHPDDIRGPWDRPLFVVILASYTPAERRSIVKIFGVRLRANGEPFASDKKTHVLGPASESDILAFGEADFLQEQVLKGPGKQFLGGGYKEWRKKTRIADVDRSLALAAAIDLIEATSKMVDLLPNRATIGGPVDAVLLGDQPRPQRLRGQAP